jgi:cystathionine beta-synthase
MLVKQEGIFAGGSSGSAMVAVSKLINKLNKKENIVAILPDSGTRYLSKFYNEGWMQENGFKSK